MGIVEDRNATGVVVEGKQVSGILPANGIIERYCSESNTLEWSLSSDLEWKVCAKRNH
jgi:hypothetical protein